MLREGGNAFDAAVAAGFAAAVAEPALTSLGGGGFLLARTASGCERLFDFFVDTPGRGRPPCNPQFLPVTVEFPGSSQVFNVGRGSVAVPGTLAGLLEVHRRLGRLRLSQVLAPAIRLARDGLRLDRQQAYFLSLLRPIMTLEAGGRALYAPGGRYLEEGSIYRNPDLARFLESLPENGPAALYAGETAERIAADMASGGGLLTREDLAAYRVVERTPISGRYRGLRVATNPPPALGGGLLLVALELLGGAEWKCKGLQSPQRAVRMVAVMEETERLRGAGLRVPADLSSEVRRQAFERVRLATGGTTHVSVCDTFGNVASMTTSNGEGSGYVVPGTGIMLNNMMGEDDLHPDGFHASPPGQRIGSMMAPCLVLDGDRVVLVAGSGGSKRIRTALLQVLSNVIDLGLDLQAAVDAPRLHWDGACVQAETGFDERVLAALERRWAVNRWSVRDVYFGGVHAAAPTGEAGGDPRRGGHVQRP
ncbi:MAG: gamma-glutamyltransferase [Candidatus Dadabacteria bacterium]|nr:MAG: gamma-glutamyltransferase [Candidatus Dadabacteria bacterium]